MKEYINKSEKTKRIIVIILLSITYPFIFINFGMQFTDIRLSLLITFAVLYLSYYSELYKEKMFDILLIIPFFIVILAMIMFTITLFIIMIIEFQNIDINTLSLTKEQAKNLIIKDLKQLLK